MEEQTVDVTLQDAGTVDVTLEQVVVEVTLAGPSGPQGPEGPGGGGGGAVSSVAGRTGDVVLTKSDVGLSNVDNTGDLSKPISTATQTALNAKASTSSLATVATSGSYTDLSNKPTIPAPYTDAEAAAAAPVQSVAGRTGAVTIGVTDVAGLTADLAAKADTTSLSPVATSGSYADLTSKPTIPAAQVNADWNASTGVAQILNKPTISGTNTGDETSASIKSKLGITTLSGANTGDQDLSGYATTTALTSGLSTKADASSLAAVATSGSYTDLSNKPTIPSPKTDPYVIVSNGLDQTAAINTALLANAGSIVELIGSFTISGPLRIPSDTALDATAATITLLSGSHSNAVQNYAVQANRRLLDGVSNATTTFTSATAAFASGDVSQPIRIYYDDGSFLDTTISSVSSSTTVVLATAAALSQTGLYFSIGPRDRNIKVIGGRWVRQTDNLASSSTAGYESNHLRFRHVDNLLVENVTLYNLSGKYSVNVGDCTGFTIKDVVGELTRSDMVHINGPCSNGTVLNVKSYGSNDDLVSMTGGDFGHTMEKMGDVMGCISQVLVDGITGTIGDDGVNGARAVLILGGQSTAGTPYRLDAIYVRNIFSKLQAAPVMIGNDTQDLYTTGGTYGRIVVDNGTNASPTGTNPNYFVRVDDSAAVDYLEVRSVKDVGTADIYVQGGGPGVTTLVTAGVDPSRVVLDATVTNYYNTLSAVSKTQTNTFTRTQTFTDTAGSEAIKTNHARIYPKSTGGSASLFLDNQNGQTFEFFANNGGSFGVYDSVSGKQPLTIDPGTTAALHLSGGTTLFTGGANLSGDINLNGSYAYNVGQMNPPSNHSGSLGISGYGYQYAYIDRPIMDTPQVPATATATGIKGQLAWDSGYIYVCTATNTWKRAALASW